MLRRVFRAPIVVSEAQFDWYCLLADSSGGSGDWAGLL